MRVFDYFGIWILLEITLWSIMLLNWSSCTITERVGWSLLCIPITWFIVFSYHYCNGDD